MIHGVLCSTGAVITRYNGRNPLLLPMLAPRIECDGFELMIYAGWYAIESELVTAMRHSGLLFPVVHADKQIGELISRNNEGDVAEARTRFDENCRIAASIGSRLVVLHLWGGVPSDHNIALNYEMCGEFIRTAHYYGLVLTVENVICAEQTPLAHLLALADMYPDIYFTIDTKMAEFHGELPATLECERLWRSGLVRHLHVNDYGGGLRDFSDLRVLHIGEGHVDFAPFFSRVKESGCDGLATVESSSVRIDGSVDFVRLNRSISLVRAGLGC